MYRSCEDRLQSRRQFLKTVAGAGAAAALGWPGRQLTAAEPQPASFSFGLVTDVHYADMPPAGSRHYRDSRVKLAEAVATFNERRLPMVVELGDFVDAGAGKADDLKYLQDVRKVFEAFGGQRHYVLGNHCVARLTKEEFLTNCGSEDRLSYYSFDRDRYHFVVLDANYRKDGVAYAAGNFSWTDTCIPKAQQQWLAEDLRRAKDRKTILFVHQNLDKEEDAHGVKNAPEVRQILEAAGNVLAVFQGHMHSGGYKKLGGIHYCTLRAMVEGSGTQNNAYGVVTLHAGDRITLEPFGQQKAIEFA